MARRIHVSSLHPGEILLDESQAHHLRDVLRLKTGSTVELFDGAGNVAEASIVRADAEGVTVLVESVESVVTSKELVIASAVPKGDRADWMIEKLSELGVTRFIPLQTARSVVHPTGAGKRDRWVRIATESAKQSHRAGVMQIDELSQVASVIRPGQIFCTTADPATPLIDLKIRQNPTLLIGPEGGWTPDEIDLFHSHNLTGVQLTATILRVETAAVAAAAIAATMLLRA